MNKIEILKKGLGFTAGLGIGQILASIVVQTTPTDTTYQKVTVYTARIAVGMVVGDIVQEHIDKKLDEFVIWWNQNYQKKIPTKNTK